MSGSGHTQKLAGFIASGAETMTGTRVLQLNVSNLVKIDWPVLHAADAIIFGCPTYMGGVSADFKAFMDETSDFWEEQAWRDKLSAGFTIGSRLSGDKLMTLQHLAIFAAQHGMLWMGQGIVGERPSPGGERHLNADGSWLGLMATSSTDKTKLIAEGDQQTAYAFGQRIAQATHRWKTGKPKT